MKIELNSFNTQGMALLDSYDALTKAVREPRCSKDGKYVIGNYGEWKIKYKNADVEGFVTANGIIDRNGKKISIKPGFIVDTEEKDTNTLFANIIDMMTDIVLNIGKPEIVNREHNMYRISVEKVLETAKRALKESVVRLSETQQ